MMGVNCMVDRNMKQLKNAFSYFSEDRGKGHCGGRLAGWGLSMILVMAAPTAGATDTLAASLQKHRLAGARVGFQVLDADDGSTLVAGHAQQSFIPASTTKIITAVGAWTALGAGHRFRTVVLAKGHREDGVLAGDLYLKGGGDPLLAVQDILDLVEQIKVRGLRRITGRFFYDETTLPRISRIAARQPAAAPYNAGISALSLDFNRIRVHWWTVGDDTVTATLSPAPGGGRIRIGGPDTGLGSAFVPDGGGENWSLTVTRLTQPTGYTELPIRDPGRRTAMAFRTLADAASLRLPVPEPGSAPDDLDQIAAIESPNLTQVIRQALAHSNNVVSELLGLAAARAVTGTKPDSLATSSTALRRWLAQRLPGTGIDKAHLPNHSGLSADARITPGQMARFLRRALGMNTYGGTMTPLLSAGGWRDGLGGRFLEPAVAGRIWGKTGTMHYATGIVGLLFGRTSGRRRVFALYVMDDARRKAYDADPAREGAAAQTAAREWIDRAKALEEALVNGWVARY